MNDVMSIQVEGIEEGEALISYLVSLELWVTPFVVIHEDNYFVKAAIPIKDLEDALMYVRQKFRPIEVLKSITYLQTITTIPNLNV